MKTIISNKLLFPDKTTEEQTTQLNELLGANEQYFTKEFIMKTIFNLPYDIIYNNVRGYLSVGPLGIEYTSLNNNYKLNIAYSNLTIPNKDLCDCLIDTLEFFRVNKDNIKILDKSEDCIIKE